MKQQLLLLNGQPNSMNVPLSNAKINSVNTSTICYPNCELIDDVSISYSKITWEYRDSNGNKVVTSYNAKTGI